MGDDPSKEAASTEAPPAQPVATPPHPKEKAGWSPSGIGVLSLLCDPVAITSILAWSRARRWLRAVARREAAGVWAPDHVALRTNAAWGVALGLVRPGALLLVACFGLGAGLEALAARALPVDREREAAERLGLASVESDEVLRELLRGDADRRRQAAADLRAIAEEGYEDLPAAEVLSALRRLAHGEPAGPGSPALDDEEEGRALAGSLLGALAAASQRHGGSTWPELARELAAQPLPPLGDQAERDTLVLLLACGKGPASACGDPWSGSLRATIEGLLGRAPGWRGADGAPLGLPVLTLEGLHRGRPVVGRRLLSYEGHGLVAAQGLAVVTSYCEANGRGAPRPRGDPPESDLPEDRAWLAELAPPVIAKRVDALAPRLASPETRLSALREAKTLARLSSCVEGLDEGLVRFAELGREDEAVDWIVADTRAQL
ncbi:MAG TPA: hypothetical protein RMF84_18550, partial [Polyangiaceae bacterium LLY-WYZ-14_1]|nr:hypothetical protein [Polyangiaceae bacterium LLY-WYZ-14_1]